MAKKARPTKISTATTKAREGGFSLIEVLVAVCLMVMVVGVFVPSFTSAFRVRGESVARRIALILGQARDRAMLTNKLVRFKIDFDKQIVYLEEASGDALVPKTPDHPPSEREREELEKKEAETWHPVEDLMKEPIKLQNLKVLEVDSPRYKKPVTEGITSVYIFGNGTTDGATIYFETDEKVHQAITLHSVTGVAKIENKGPENK